jgi:hypothetical protein
MTLKNFLKHCGFNASVSIYEVRRYYDKERGEVVAPSHLYCDNVQYPMYNKTQCMESQLECWDKIKNRKIKRWSIVGNSRRQPLELIIELKPKG